MGYLNKQHTKVRIKCGCVIELKKIKGKVVSKKFCFICSKHSNNSNNYIH